jgi:hypothetical protein
MQQKRRHTKRIQAMQLKSLEIVGTRRDAPQARHTCVWAVMVWQTGASDAV